MAGKLGPFLDPQPEYHGTVRVNEALASITREVPLTKCAEADGLDHKGDSTHFNTESLIEFGKRYARAMQSLGLS